MPIISSILADGESAIVKVVIFIIVLVFWGIGALAKLGKKTAEQAKAQQAEQERLVRAHWEEVRRREAAAAHGQQQQQMQQGWPAPPPLPPASWQQQQQPQPPPRQRGPVVPPMRNLPQPQQRPGRPRPVVPMPPPPQAVRRPQAAKQQNKQKPQRRRVQPPPMVPSEPLPGSSRRMVAADTPGVIESEIGQGTTSASPTRRQADAAVNMISLTPRTLREQFILTELLQPPLALRDPARRER